MGAISCWTHRGGYHNREGSIDNMSESQHNQNYFDYKTSSVLQKEDKKLGKTITLFKDKNRRQNGASRLATSEISSDSHDISKSDGFRRSTHNTTCMLNYSDVDIEKYSKENDNKVLWVIDLLSQQTDVDYSIMSIYNYALIRDFIFSNGGDVHQAVTVVMSDIHWRQQNLPIDQKSLSNVLKSERIYVYGCDKYMNPWIYLKPNASFGDFYSGKTRINIQEYLNYMIYCFENISNSPGYSNKFTIIADFDQKAIDFKLLEAIHRLTKQHYPTKI